MRYRVSRLPVPRRRRGWIYRSDFEEMGFFSMPTLFKAKNGLENHQKLAHSTHPRVESGAWIMVLLVLMMPVAWIPRPLSAS
jgi:hypothetical protein